MSENVVLRVPYIRSKSTDNARETHVLQAMEEWLKVRKIELKPCSAYASLGEAAGSYNFDNDNTFKYLNIRLPKDIALLFKLTWGAGVV